MAGILPVAGLACAALAPCSSVAVRAPSSITAPSATPAPGPSPIEVLEAWLELYHKGELDLTGARRQMRGRGARNRPKDFVSIASGLFDESLLARMTHERELRMLCKAVLELQDAAAARALLKVAAVGLDRKDYAPAQNPVVVRQIGEQHLAELAGASARELVVAVAAGRPGVPGSDAMRAAALRTLGLYRDEQYRTGIEAVLGERSWRLRMAAATGLGRSLLKTAVPALADRLTREREPAVVTTVVDALAEIVRKQGTDVDARDLRRAVTAALDTLGEHGWNVDLAILDFLGPLRVVDAVPALIDVLARHAEGARRGRDADTSPVVSSRAHEILMSLTGAVFPAARPDQWSEWWVQNRETFEVVEAEAAAAKRGPAADRTVTSSFFGIPVTGRRIVFVVDVSLSMDWDWDDRETKMDVAKRELQRAVEQLPADASFNLVTFATGERTWKPKLVPAKRSNKKAFVKYVDKLRTAPHTNVWAGLEHALALQEIVYGERTASSVDEVFVLSDGAPTTGEIRNPSHILETVAEANRINRVRINTIYIERGGGGRDGGGPGGGGRGAGGGRGGGPQWGMSGAELMKALAEQNGGRFLEPGS